MTDLKELESKSIYIIREVRSMYKNPAVLCSWGKDSTTLLHLIRKAFHGKIPFKVIHIDTTFKFPEIYRFRDEMTKKWDIDLIITKNDEELKKGMSPEKSKFECCNQLKTQALKQCINKNKFDVVLAGIRRDEHGIRNKEHYFSPRDKNFRWRVSEENNQGDSGIKSLQDPEFSGWEIYATYFGKETDHVRCHPLLGWSEIEIWEYIKQNNLPIVSLYFAKNGKRYRSIGCEHCCGPVESNADDIDKIIEELKTTQVKERDGRAQDKENEYNMQKLRSLGYM